MTGTGCALPVGISVEKEDPTGVSWQVSIFPFVRLCSNCDEFDVCQLKEEEKGWRVHGEGCNWYSFGFFCCFSFG